MLFSLALGNIRRSFRNYGAYFLSAAFSAFVLYLFLSITFGKAAESIANFQATKAIFAIGAGLTGMFTVFFIWYSNTFFIKSRKKEFATYMLLGMTKRQTIRLCFLENLAILALAYGAGIAAGILLNKYLIMLLLTLMKMQAAVPFEVCGIALQVSTWVYVGVFAIISIHSITLLSRTTLLDLISAQKKAEKVLGVSLFTYIIGIAALVLLGFGYFLSITAEINPLLWMFIVAIVCLGTLLFFTSVASLFFHFTRRNQTRLYSGTRLISVSQLMHRYRGNVGVLSVIAITTSVALCAVLTCCSLANKIEENTRGMRPYSVEYTQTGNGADSVLQDALKRHPEVAVKSTVQLDMLKAMDSADEKTGTWLYILISQSNYNAAMAALGNDTRIALASDKDCHVISNQRVYQNPGSSTIYAAGKAYDFRVASFNKTLYLSTDRFRRTYVVTDSTFAAAKADGAVPYTVTGMLLANDARSAAFERELGQVMPKDNRVLTFNKLFEENWSMMTVMMFVGVFIGLLFVAATGGILYFRMVMEATEDRAKYITLAKLGVSAREMRAAIAKQLAIIFGAPLVLAIANSFAAMFQLEKMVNLVDASMKGTFLMVAGVYSLCFAAYYLVTLNKYVKTVRAAE